MGCHNSIVKTYKNVRGYDIDVYGCWDERKDYNNGKRADFYDIYDQDGTCLNEGDPIYRKPTRSEVEELVEEWDIFTGKMEPLQA